MAENAVSAAVKDGVDASLRDAGRAYMIDGSELFVNYRGGSPLH